MQTDLQLQNDKALLKIRFDDLAEAEKFFAEAQQQTGFFLHLSQELKQFQKITVEASALADGFEFGYDLPVEVVQVFPAGAAFGTAFQLCDWNLQKAVELGQRLRGEEAAKLGKKPEGMKRELSESELSPMFRIKQMNPTERFRLATRANRTERQILLRDNSPQVLVGLLQNPRIELKEVIEVIKSHFATGRIMETVARNRTWMANPQIPGLIAMSTKTPPQLAIKLMPTLRKPDLQKLAKSNAVRENVKKAALKAYMKRIKG